MPYFESMSILMRVSLVAVGTLVFVVPGILYPIFGLGKLIEVDSPSEQLYAWRQIFIPRGDSVALATVLVLLLAAGHFKFHLGHTMCLFGDGSNEWAGIPFGFFPIHPVIEGRLSLVKSEWAPLTGKFLIDLVICIPFAAVIIERLKRSASPLNRAAIIYSSLIWIGVVSVSFGRLN